VFLLLDSITEKEGKEKWETKAAQIHKVCLTGTRITISFRCMLTM
jgi:CCR4-NOT transcription complex subunit 1